MRKYLSIAFVLCVAGGVLFARPDMQKSGAPKQESERKDINLKADLAGPVSPGDSVTFLVGNFAAQHNGAVIICDSAVRYTPDHIEFFGNVLINKNTTYIYGDRAEYNGLLNEARVYSDIVKVVDGDATLYTYQFAFNTLTNIGTFGGGGVLINRDNLLESDRGLYNSNTKDLTCVYDVQIRNNEYQLKSDSVIYNVDTDRARYFEHTNIWNIDGDYLYADRGEYLQQPDTLYKVTLNGYILTKLQEVWSDSIDYYRPREHAILRRNVQIDDTEHKTLAFGDYGEYWKVPGNALLTLRPSAINYDPEQGDSLFMRADTMFLYTILTRDVTLLDSLGKPVLDSLGRPEVAPRPGAAAGGENKRPNFGRGPQGKPADAGAPVGEGEPIPQGGEQSADSVAVAPPIDHEQLRMDSLRRDSLEQAMTPAQKKERLREAARKAKADQKEIAMKEREALLDTIAVHRQAKITKRLLAEKAQEERMLERRKAKAEARLRKRQARALRRGQEMPDSSILNHYDSLILQNAHSLDSLAGDGADSMLRDSLAAIKSDSLNPADTMYRLVKGYRNVRTYRTDFQSVCDSLVAISRDSTIHLYINPVLWNETNQITSDVMDIFTANQQIVRAEFIGKPMMISELDTMYYNQVTGKKMEAFFRENRIFRNDVNGSAQTIYFIQESDDPEVKGMMVIESGNISFYINDQNKIEKITYRNDVAWNAYPMDKIPPEVTPFLKDFKWEGKRRPSRDDVFDRKIRPSERAERLAIPGPDFPLATKLDYDKQYFKSKGWADRGEKVAPDIDEWMRSLGFPTGQPRPRGQRP